MLGVLGRGSRSRRPVQGGPGHQDQFCKQPHNQRSNQPTNQLRNCTIEGFLSVVHGRVFQGEKRFFEKGAAVTVSVSQFCFAYRTFVRPVNSKQMIGNLKRLHWTLQIHCGQCADT